MIILRLVERLRGLDLRHDRRAPVPLLPRLRLHSSLVLLHVVNRQSFHWSMDVSVPWGGLAAFAATLLALALLATLVAARQAMSDDAVRAVKDDW